METMPIVRDSLALYLEEIRKFPLLSREEELELACKWRDQKDVLAAQQLVLSNLRFVVKIASQYRNYGVTLLDLVQEGNIGLMMAVRKFNPHRGYRLISYAVWWIRAYIHNFIIRAWSLVKVGTTQAQRRLFAKLRKTQDAIRKRKGSKATAEEVALQLDVDPAVVGEMDLRLAGHDFSLDAAISDEPGSATFVDRLAVAGPNQEEVLAEQQEKRAVAETVQNALQKLSQRERDIIEQRLMKDKPRTLEQLGQKYSVSRERVRQIEEEAKLKMRRLLPASIADATA